VWQIFSDEKKLPPLSWFLIFAGLYRLIFLLSFPILPALYESSDIGFGYSGQTPSALAIYLVHWPGGAIFYWRIILLLLESALGFLLFILMRYFGISAYRMLILLLNPLWIIEIFRNGHGQLTGILLLWLAISLFYLKKDWTALPATVLSFFVSMVPLPAYLPFLYKKFWLKVILLLTGMTLIIFIFSSTGMMPSYHFIFAVDREAFNGLPISAGIYFLEYFNFVGQEDVVINWFGYPVAVYTRAEFYILLPIAFIILAVIIAQIKKLNLTVNFRSINYLQSSFVVSAALLLFSPVLHPWHLLWILPFIVFLPNWSWLFFTALIQISYLVPVDQATVDSLVGPGWILLLQYVPFYGMLIAEYLDQRRIKGWF
jgi:hypothetical protein